MFENVAPVLPEVTLAALERVSDFPPDVAIMVWQRHLALLRSLAYDQPLFERSVQILAKVSTQVTDVKEAKVASDTFVSLFMILRSGTHATIEQRLSVIEQLLRSGEAKAQALGLAAVGKVLMTRHFSSGYRFDFGARSRDYGYQPQSDADLVRWYGAVLALIERLALTDRVLKQELCGLLGHNFRGLWALTHMHGELERLSRRIAAEEFWREGWVACRQTMHFDRDRMSPEAALLLSALEADLRPFNLQGRVRAVVLGDRSGSLDLEDMDIDDDPMSAIERLEAIARKLGSEVATDEEVFAELLPDLLRGGSRAWAFGRGLAVASPDLRATWTRLVEGLARIALEQRNVQVFRGFLAELWEKDRDLAQELLDSALDEPALLAFLPDLHSAVGLDERGAERLKRALSVGEVPVWMYRNLAWGGTSDQLEGGALKDLILLIADQPDGFEVALEILYMRLHADRSAQREHESKLLEAGRELLLHVRFSKDNDRGDYKLASIVKSCLSAPDTGPIAAKIAVRLRQAVETSQTYSWDNDDLLTALFEVQPAAVLEALFEGNEEDQQAGIGVFEHLENEHRKNPADEISCEALIYWCEGDRERRYPLAASIITFAHRPEASGPQVWSEQAKSLLANAPDPRSVLAVLIERFQPSIWSGSRAALIEANARLLDSLESLSPSFMQFVTEAKANLMQEVARERQWETKIDRVRDERFE